ncbi:fibrinogen-like protein A [Patiria miniata]|uniref:Fibrinogen C-terminal domain-containing protein n=1 Tax=Patiria miniata TaxID=46514 RepID=A0A914ACX8_PATMI|nr:fibrinogen-like protein A [Patiria miniata]
MLQFDPRINECRKKLLAPPTMANPNFVVNAFKLLIALAMVFFVDGYKCNSRQQIMYAAESRAMQGFGYANKTVRSRVICGRECSMDERCKSFNFNDCSKTCELNLATRREHPEDFHATPGGVYYDTDEDTPHFSVTDSFYRSCKMLLDCGYRSSGVYAIQPEGFGNGSLRVYCDMETDGGGWIVFQRRQDGSVDFYRNWAEYQAGFGNLSGEFWLGNDNLVTLTSNISQATWELRVDLGDWEGDEVWAMYEDFKISPGEYNLNYEHYDEIKSTASNSLGYSIHNRSPFSTMDHDNDLASGLNCAEYHKGAWWFGPYICLVSNLNGNYHHDGTGVRSDYGIVWFSWYLPPYSLKTCSMKMREMGP